MNIPASVHQSASEIIQPGDSVTLNCTVHTGSCDGEHSVYWCKNSEDSPGLIYTRGGRNDQCERKPNTQTHTCVYNLPMESLNLSHAGTHCAVASCGHILFGNGTKLDFEGRVNYGQVRFKMNNKIKADRSVFGVYSLQMRSTLFFDIHHHPECFTGFLSVLLLGVNLKNRSRRQRDQTWSECLYYSQPESKSVQPGDSVTVSCSHTGQCSAEHTIVTWLKNSQHSAPQSIYFSGNGTCQKKESGKTTCVYSLLLRDLSSDDAAPYYCVVTSCGQTLVGDGTRIYIHSKIETIFLKVSKIIQPGDTVTLNCTVHTGSCDGEHSVYWFKNSEDSPGLIYTRGGRNDQCERKPNTQTHTCVYNLPMESLNLSHAGTHCAVASCGHILFGNGTKLDFEDEVDSLVYFLSIALTFTTILSDHNNGRGEKIYCAALGVNLKNRSRRQRDQTWSE
ncbi:hypothetical protein F7725_028998, partial [Dissostichus mawsoni]